jgi:hypothetical protein
LSLLKAYVANQSDHPFQTIGCWGTSLTCEVNLHIPPGQTECIGGIEVPTKADQNWGWWYVQDSRNKAVFECFADVSASAKINPRVDMGLKANAAHLKDGPGGPTPNPAPIYLRADAARDAVVFQILPAWTQTPPDYIFNYGHYCCFTPHAPGRELVAHAYVIVRSFNGEKRVDFACYGGVTPDYHPEEWVDVAGTYLGTADQLRLARVICCFDPDDQRDVYNLTPFYTEALFKPVGRLGLGDCSGLIFGVTGVCHTMANRIAAAVTEQDAGAWAAMPAYYLTHFIWETYGGLPPIGSEAARLKPLAQTLFAHVCPSKLEQPMIRMIEDASYPVNLLVQPWETYLKACKKLAQV